MNIYYYIPIPGLFWFTSHDQISPQEPVNLFKPIWYQGKTPIEKTGENKAKIIGSPEPLIGELAV